MALAGEEIDKEAKNAVLALLGEPPRAKYETGLRASQNWSVFRLSENPIGACLTPMVVHAH
jgi:hypothetical protein